MKGHLICSNQFLFPGEIVVSALGQCGADAILFSGQQGTGSESIE